jgi:cytochrome c-type biogenesis protein CcmE
MAARDGPRAGRFLSRRDEVIPTSHKSPRAASCFVRKAGKVLILLVLVGAGGALAFAGAAPEGYRGVAEVVDDPAAFAGRDIQVKASVVEGSLRRDATPITFLLGEGARALEVRWDPAHPIPDHEAGGTIEGKNVVVMGTLVQQDGEVYLLAHEMTVGCASKYRPEEG